MKNVFLCFLLLLGVYTVKADEVAKNAGTTGIEFSTGINDLPVEMRNANAETFLTMTPAKFKTMTGRKMKLKEVIALKSAQKAAKKAMGGDEGAEGGAKSQLIALILALLIGYLGIHRFYLGYTTIGIIQILTLGGCGIWALIDAIMIATGDLKPADGSDYDPKL